MNLLYYFFVALALIQNYWLKSSVQLLDVVGQLTHIIHVQVKKYIFSYFFLKITIIFYNQGVMPNVPSSNEYKGGFGSALMLKDLGLSQDAATRTNTSTPMGSLAMHVYRIMCNSGFENKDFGSAFEFLKKK